MDKIFKRFTCLILALLMVLEVFSPVAVAAAGLLEEAEVKNSTTTNQEKLPEEIFTEKTFKTEEKKQKDTRTEYEKSDKFLQPAKKPAKKAVEKEGDYEILVPAKKQVNKENNVLTAPEKEDIEKDEKKLQEEKKKEEAARLEQEKLEALKIEAAKQEAAARANERESLEAEAEYREARDKRIELEKKLEELERQKGLRDQKKKSENSLNSEESNKLNKKEDIEEKQVEEEEEKGFLEKLKEGLGLTDLQRADKELKKALANKENGLEEIQALLNTFEDKYDLSREDQEKLMADNEEAFQELIERDREENFRSDMLMANPVGASPDELKNKKFTIRTRLDTSTITGPIQPGEFFEIKLDQRLTVKTGTILPNIVNDGTVLAKPEYNESTNTIKYTVENPIAKDLQIPIAIDVDYNVEKIKEIDEIKDTHAINNSISGLGVVRPVKLPEVMVNNNGDIVNGISEEDGHEVLQIVEPGSDYKVYMDAHGSPVVKGGKLVAINWSVTFTSTRDLFDLGLSSNATTVKGSGLGDFSNLLLNGDELRTEEDGLSVNEIEGQLGIVASKNHTLKKSLREVRYTCETKITNPQEKYALDLSVALKNIEKTGAVRLVYDAKDNKSYMEDTTSKRVGINNRTTIMGEFSSDTTARWTVTDAVSTGDKNNGLPIATRELTGDQELTSAKMAVYGLDRDTGKMVIKQSVDAPESQITTIPGKEENPSGNQLPGRIAVYEFNTDITDSEAGYSLSGVNINKYQPIKVKQTWSGIDSTQKMPEQTIEVKDANGNTLSSPITVGEGEKGQADRVFDIPAVKTWKIEKKINQNTGEEETVETKITPNIVQTFPQGPTIDEKTYSYKEKYNYYSLEDGAYHLYNVMTESTDEKDSSFTIIKTDSKDPTKKLAGAEFTLQRPGETLKLQTDANGQINFKNISPGTYNLTENKAPAGYKLDQEPKQITVHNDGTVSVEGNNISMQGGKVATVLARHNYYPSYPSYMNAMHYGSIDENGNVEFYIYLKPEANSYGGSTDKDTRLNLNLTGGGNITSVEVLDVAPGDRYTTRNIMQKQTASEVTGTNLINVESQGTETITGAKNVEESFTGKTGYQIKFPAARFNNDWGFLVKVKANGGTSTSTVSYDWLTDNDRVADESKIQETIGLSTKNSSDSTSENPTSDVTRITITNEEFQKSPVELTKLDENGVDGLSGATFTLKDSNGNPIIDVQSQDEGEGKTKGLASFGNQAPGNYTIEEKKAPKGYKNSNVVFDVNVSEDGKVTYKARFKDGNGTPINGLDYILEDVEVGQDSTNYGIKIINQSMKLQEKQSQPDDGRIGWTEGVWEAYGIESYRYYGSFTIDKVVKGGRFKIQFDPNLDFKRYVYEIPDLKDGEGNLLAKPYFNYDTNLLTYVFVKDATGVSAEMEIIGIIPDKYFATQTNKTSGYNFKITVDPDNPEVANMTSASSVTDKQTTVSNNNILDFNVKTDYYGYDSQGGGGPLTSEYITDIYKGDDGEIYMKAVSYYNPTNLSSGPRTVRLDWLSMRKPRPGLEYYRADGYPAFGFDDLKVYKVFGDQNRKQNLMPLSYGIRPEKDTSDYIRVYSKSNVNPKQGFSESGGDVRVTYNPDYLKSYEGLLDNGHNKHPLEIDLPRVSGNEGYVIVQTFKVKDEQRFKDLWSGYYLSNGSRHTGSYQKGNYNWAIGSETGQEIPKFYSQRIKLINKTYKPGSFRIKKTNEVDNTDLPGAIFELKNQEGKTINRYSGSDGLVEFIDLEPGIYTLQEAKAPDGFIKLNRRWQVVVYDTGNVVINEVGGSGTSFTGKDTILIPVSNKPSGGDFKVYKKDSTGKALPGAKFKITKHNDTSFTPIEAESNANGVVEFKGLNQGTYIIEETEAPAGYTKLDKKWVLVVDADGKKKVYNYREKSDQTKIGSILEQKNVNWVNVAGRSLDGWNLYDNRRADWTGNYPTPFKLGTRIVGINTTEKYVIQRYVLNPEAESIGKTTGTIHREKIEYQNMDWYNGKAKAGKDYQVYKLDKAVTGPLADIRLADYGAENITSFVEGSAKQVAGKYGEPDRLSLDFPATDKPIVVDIKVPYNEDTGGVGTGMDWVENGTTYWKSDYYERVNIIKESGPVLQGEEGGIQGSYIADDSLDVTNQSKTFGFKLKKVKEDNAAQAIQGAEFKLTGPDKGDGSKQEERFMTTGSNGMISFDNLKPGTYKLEENKAAPGYEKATNDWTVRITDEGKVFIKVVPKTTETTNANGEEVAAQPALEPVAANTILTVEDPNSTEAQQVRNVRLAKQMQDLRSAQYGLVSKADEKSLVKSQAEINQDYIRQNINAVYGENNLENQLADGLTFGEIAMVAYNRDFALGTGSGLEISDPIVPEAQRASGWQAVDPNKSTIASHQDGDGIQTKITRINKDTKEFTQVFLIDASKTLGNKPIMINYHTVDNTITTPKNIRVYKVTNDSTVNNLKPIGGDIKYKGPFGDNYFTGNTINFATSKDKFAIEFTDKYTEGSKLGLEVYYLYDRQNNPPLTNWKYSVANESYENEGFINYKHLITINPSTGGSVTSDVSRAKENDVVTFTVRPADGYELASLKINNTDQTAAGKKGTFTMRMPNYDVNVTATFKPISQGYSINIDPNIQNGSVTSNVSRAKENDVVRFTVTPADGYELASLTINNTDQTAAGKKGTFTMGMPNYDVNVTATFKPISQGYSINIDPNIKNGKVTSNKSSAASEEEFTLTITPDPGYKLGTLSINGYNYTNIVANNQATFTIGNQNLNVSATFVRDPYKSIISFDPNGGSGVMKNQEVYNGYQYTIPNCEFAPPAGKEFLRWTINGYPYTPGTVVTINQSYTLKAEWKDAPVNLVSIKVNSLNHKTTYKVGEELDVTNLTIEATMSNGTKQIIPVNPGMVSGFSSANEAKDMPLTITYGGKTTTYNINVVKPEPDAFDINIISSNDGKVEADKLTAKAGEEVTLTATANEGYTFHSFKVTDESGNPIAVTDNKFTMPKSAVNVSASFTQDGGMTPGDEEIEIGEGEFAQITNRQTGIELNIFKKNNADIGLIGAEFELKKDDGTDTIIAKAVSGEEGNVKFVGTDGKPIKLQVGNYLLTETKSPAGYKKPAAPWKLQVVEEGGQLVIKESGPKHTSTSYLSSEGAKAGDNTSSSDAIKYKSIIKNIDPVNKTFVQRIYIDTRGYNGKVNVQITPTTKREEIDIPSTPPTTTKGGVKTAYRTTYKVANPGEDPDVDAILKDYDLRKSNVSVVNTARWRPFDWGFDEDQINLENNGVYFIDIEGFYDDNIVDLEDIELKVDFYGGERIFAQRTFDPETGQLGWKYDKDIGVDEDGNQIKRDAAYLLGTVALKNYYERLKYNEYIRQGQTEENAKKNAAADAEVWYKSNQKNTPQNGKYDVWLSKGANIDGKYYDSGRIVLANDPTNPNNNRNTNPIQTSMLKANIKDLYSSDSIKTVPQDGMTITNEDETYNITFSKHAKMAKDGEKEDYDNNRLEGAVFKLQKKEGSFWYDLDESYVASAFNGYFGFRRLEPGRYRLLEVTPPTGYKPLDGTLLEFTIKQLDTSSNKIINPRTKTEVALIDLTIIDPYNAKQIVLRNAQAKIKEDPNGQTYNFSDLVNDPNFDIDKCLILSEDKDEKGNQKEIPLKSANFIDPETNEPMGKIIAGAQGYITLEYSENGYVSEYGKPGSTGGTLVDYVTSATAKNMGKILNEKPGKGKVTIKKLDENGKALGATADASGELTVGAKFQAIRISGKKDAEGKPVKEAVYEGTVDENGILVIDGLPVGNYELKEVANPSGHINTGQIWHFTVGGKDLDPYSGDIARTGQNLTDKIILSKSDLKVVRPNAEDEEATGHEGNDVIRPHVGQTLEFDNEFKLDPNIEIRPGDYFVLKLSDNIDLEGVRTDGVGNLDLFADGVGTIAKAEYDKEAGTITYTFTKYAEQYKLLSMENRLGAHISLKNQRNSDPNAKVGLSVGNSKVYHDINIKYVVDTIERTYDNATVSLASKITEYNSKTGEFVHYFYVNRDRYYNAKDQYFTYKPNVDVEDLQLTYYKLRNNDKNSIKESMPESFAVNENDRNLYRSGGTSPEYVSADETKTYNLGKIGSSGYDSMIIKVTGRMKDVGTENQVLSYKGISGLYSKYNYSYDSWGNYIGPHVSYSPYVDRWDAIYAFDNTNTASAELTIQAVNPSNRIQFKKVDPQGQLIKDKDGNVLTASFSLFKNGGTAEKPNETWTPKGNAKTIDKDGIVLYEKLEEGYYKLVETTAPAGYIKPTEAVAYFKVDSSGKIYHKVTVTMPDGKETKEIFQPVEGTVPINIVNNKAIEFEKVDATDNTKKLKDAEFDVYYKETPDGDYNKFTVKKNVDGKEKDVTVTAKSDADGKFKLEVTKDGYYALKETKAPDGYTNFPGYIKEFKLEKGKVLVLEKDPLKASLTKGEKGMLTSEILEVDKDKGTFKQRLVINPNHSKWTFDDSDSHLRLFVDGWNVEETNTSKLIKVAVLDKGKTVSDLTEGDFKSVTPTNYPVTAATNPLKYSIEDMYGSTNYTRDEEGRSNLSTDKTLVVEFTGKLKENATSPVNPKSDVYINAFDRMVDEVTNRLDITKPSESEGAYIDSTLPIQIENRKGQYPLTGGRGTLIFTLAGLMLMSAAAYVYKRKRGVSYDEEF